MLHYPEFNPVALQIGPVAFLMGYGVVRFISEFFREPDDFLGLLALNLSMGQWLCIPMIAAGMAIWLWGRGRQPR